MTVEIKRHNERVKLSATFINLIAVGCVTGGVVLFLAGEPSAGFRAAAARIQW